MNHSMISDQISRMDKLDASYRSEYEAALKYTSATALVGEISLKKTQEGRILLIACTAGSDTVCSVSFEYEFFTYGTCRQVQH